MFTKIKRAIWVGTATIGLMTMGIQVAHAEPRPDQPRQQRMCAIDYLNGGFYCWWVTR